MTTDDRGLCAACPSSLDGCAARQAATRRRCCSGCTHGVVEPVITTTIRARSATP